MRVLTITLNCEDHEFSALLQRIGERGMVAGLDGDADVIQPGDTPGGDSTTDKRGVPWIDGIHAKTKTMTAAGEWRRSKGVTEAQLAAAEKPYLDQIAAMKAAGQPTFHVPQSIAGVPGGVNLPDPNTAFQPQPGAPMPQFPSVGGAPMPMPGMPMPLPVAPAPVDVPVSYDDISNKYNALVGGGRLTADGMFAIYRNLGIVDPTSLTTDETLRRKVKAELDKLG